MMTLVYVSSCDRSREDKLAEVVKLSPTCCYTVWFVLWFVRLGRSPEQWARLVSSHR